MVGDIDENEGYIRNKWSEQEMIQTRRSVSSSPSSESESNDLQNENRLPQKLPSNTQNSMEKSNSITLRPNEIVINDNIQDMQSYATSQQQQQHPSGQMSQFNIPNENGPVSLFPPSSSGGLNTQIPFPSPGAAMFPPTFVNAFSTAVSTTNAQTISKHAETPTANSTNTSLQSYTSSLCAAAFTSSSRNIALTTSMMAPSPVQTDVSSITSPNNINDLTQPIPSHITGNNNSSSKIDFNREYQMMTVDSKLTFNISNKICYFTDF